METNLNTNATAEKVVDMKARKEFQSNPHKFATTEEALVALGLGWTAQEQGLMTAPSLHDVKNFKAIVRSDTNGILGVVGKNWEVVQPSIAGAFADVMSKEKGGWISSSNVWDGGSRISLNMKFPTPESWVVRNKGDRIQTGMKIIMGFDGKTGIYVQPTFTVLTCMNGAMMRGVVMNAFHVRHSKMAKERIAEALRIYAGVDVYLNELLEKARFLDQKIFDKAAVKLFVEECFPVQTDAAREAARLGVGEPNGNAGTIIPAQTITARNEVYRLFFEGMGNQGRSAWDAYNALTEYLDHHKYLNADRAEKTSTFGTSRKLKEKAFDYLMAL